MSMSDPYMALRLAQGRETEDSRRATRWRLARDRAESQRAARRADQPVRDELVQGLSVPVGQVIKLWWRSALQSVRLAGWA